MRHLKRIHPLRHYIAAEDDGWLMYTNGNSDPKTEIRPRFTP